MATAMFTRLPLRTWEWTARLAMSTVVKKSSSTNGDSAKKKVNKKSLVNLHMENQQLFGNLLETSVQRRKRLTKISKAAAKVAAKSVNIAVETVKEVEIVAVKKETLEATVDRNQVKPTPLQEHFKLCQLSVRNGVIPEAWEAFQMPMMLKPEDLPFVGDGSEMSSVMPPELKSRLPSVTKVLSETMTPEAKAVLEAWKQRMIEKLGLEGFQQMQRETLERGKLLHEFVLNRLLRLPEKDPESVIANYMKSLRLVLPSMKDVKVELSEKPVYHPFLGYWGIPDCVASYKGTPVIVDWKTSQRFRRTVQNLYDGPLQLAAYVGAMNALHPTSQIDHGMVVVAYESGDPADVHVFSKRACEAFWVKWIDRLKRYRELVAARSSPTSVLPIGELEKL